MNHKDWLDNEYSLWAKALESSTVHNFREHPQVKRMLSEIDPSDYWVEDVLHKHWDLLLDIQSIGYPEPQEKLSGAFIRMIYWALKTLEKNPESICEIGGGVGEFYAILRALGYDGLYYIYDLERVKEFQIKFLNEAERLTGLSLPIGLNTCNFSTSFCVSFYALGEFDDLLKQWYIETVVNRCEHGLIVWNPHSGASKEININRPYTIEELQDGTFKITW